MLCADDQGRKGLSMFEMFLNLVECFGKNFAWFCFLFVLE